MAAISRPVIHQDRDLAMKKTNNPLGRHNVTRDHLSTPACSAARPVKCLGPCPCRRMTSESCLTRWC
jgi:hypothetical protein